MCRLLAFAVGVELFAEVAEGRRVRYDGKWVWIEAMDLVVAGIISYAETTSRREHPYDVHDARQNP